MKLRDGAGRIGVRVAIMGVERREISNNAQGEDESEPMRFPKHRGPLIRENNAIGKDRIFHYSFKIISGN